MKTTRLSPIVLSLLLVIAAPTQGSQCSESVTGMDSCPSTGNPAETVKPIDPIPGEPGPIENFHTVVKGAVYRGAAPDEAGVEHLAQDLHVKTDIDLESFRVVSIEVEKAHAKKNKIKFLSDPVLSLPGDLAYLAPINDKKMEEALRTMLNPKKQPVFVHCYRGMDRTGLLIGLYLVKSGKMTPEQAYQDMLAHNFHPKFKALDDYFRKETGYSGP